MKKFRRIYVEITNICNMHCSFCPETNRAKATMSTNSFEYIASEICKYTDYVYLHVKGEPLLHPNLEEILGICEKYNLKVNISTNGTLITKRKELLKNIRQINISLHSFENKSQIELEEYLEQILNAADELEKSGVIIRYKLWNDNTINNNNSIISKLSQKYSVDITSATAGKDIKLGDNIYLSIKTPFTWPEINSSVRQESTCYGLRQQIAILVDGTVVPCCVDNNGDINLGNIFETSLDQILCSSKAEKIKKDFENNKCSHDLCKRCEYRNYVT